MILLGEISGSTFILAAVVAMVLLVLVRSQKSLRKAAIRPSLPPPERTSLQPSPSHHSPKSVGADPQHLQAWEVRMHDLARDLSGQLDSKMSALSHLIRDAQQQVDRLERLLAERERMQAESPRSVIASGLPPAPHIPTQAAGLGYGGSGRTSGDRLNKQQRQEDIFALSDAGHTSATIAQRVGSPVGEVELILSLRPSDVSDRTS